MSTRKFSHDYTFNSLADYEYMQSISPRFYAVDYNFHIDDYIRGTKGTLALLSVSPQVWLLMEEGLSYKLSYLRLYARFVGWLLRGGSYVSVGLVSIHHRYLHYGYTADVLNALLYK